MDEGEASGQTMSMKSVSTLFAIHAHCRLDIFHATFCSIEGKKLTKKKDASQQWG